MTFVNCISDIVYAFGVLHHTPDKGVISVCGVCDPV